MSLNKSIFMGAVVIVAGIIFAGGVTKATTNDSGPYQLMQHSNNTANAGVFRLDTSSGEVSYCYVASSGGAEVICTKPVK